ncbi:MAG TPA: CoA transferase [Egicoccus sp.]|nr:CoA transferase [Egicoccus sp.]HSK23027.1 CoA transferase [Egicoccus sp.]
MTVDGHPGTAAAGLLAGVRVLDLSRVLAGPFGASLLAEMGAEVIKVEFPAGDPVRGLGPHRGDRSLYFSSVNTGKHGVVIDPDDPRSREHLAHLLDAADVVVENFRPQAAAALNLDVASLHERHPHLVIVTVSGFAHSSPRAAEAAYDLTVQAEAGIMALTGDPGGAPSRAGVPLSDLAGGLFAALGAAAGLVSRGRTGAGVHVEVPLLDATLPLLSYVATAAADAGVDPPPVGSGHHRIVPYGAFEASDGWIVIAALGDKFWVPLCEALGLPDLAARDDLRTSEGRLAARDEVDTAVAGAVARLTASRALERLRAADVPAAPVLGVLDALSTDYVRQRGMVRSVESEQGAYTVVQGPLRAGGRPRPAPDLDEDSRTVQAAWVAAGAARRSEREGEP